MSERINELVDKTSEIMPGVYSLVYESGGRGVEFTEDALGKFVELLVKECADLCDKFQARDVGMQPAECAGAIRKMFGVE